MFCCRRPQEANQQEAQPATPPLPSLAVVLPALDEEASIQAAIASVQRSAPVLVVDGGSSDRTSALAQSAGARVLSSPPGRGRQLNAGWRAASDAEWVLFLHADSQLPPGWQAQLADALQPRDPQQAQQHQPQWGCFRSVRLTQVPAWQRWLVEACVAQRTARLRQPYGDQALFVRRATLAAEGGFDEGAPLLEDLQLVRRLNRHGPPVVLPASVTTSGRRYATHGFWQTVLAHQAILAGYALGVAPAELVKLRGADKPGAHA